MLFWHHTLHTLNAAWQALYTCINVCNVQFLAASSIDHSQLCTQPWYIALCHFCLHVWMHYGQNEYFMAWCAIAKKHNHGCIAGLCHIVHYILCFVISASWCWWMQHTRRLQYLGKQCWFITWHITIYRLWHEILDFGHQCANRVMVVLLPVFLWFNLWHTSGIWLPWLVGQAGRLHNVHSLTGLVASGCIEANWRLSIMTLNSLGFLFCLFLHIWFSALLATCVVYCKLESNDVVMHLH